MPRAVGCVGLHDSEDDQRRREVVFCWGLVGGMVVLGLVLVVMLAPQLAAIVA